VILYSSVRYCIGYIVPVSVGANCNSTIYALRGLLIPVAPRECGVLRPACRPGYDESFLGPAAGL
jgi:hypothetical protein